MRIAVTSMFRNCAGERLQRYATQLSALLQTALNRGDRLRWIAVEGDCVDATVEEIRRYALHMPISMELVHRSHGGPVFGSTEQGERLTALSYVGDGALEAVRDDDEVLVYVESDLMWDALTIYRLIDRLQQGIDVIAPLVFAGENFYDVWGYRKDGVRFSPYYPYHSELAHDGSLTIVDSAGSCLVMRGEVARVCRLKDGLALRGFCQDVRDHGYTIYVDASARVEHPA